MESSELRSSKRRKTATHVSVVASSPDSTQKLQSPSVSHASPRRSSRPLVTYGHNKKTDRLTTHSFSATTITLDTGGDGAVFRDGKFAASADSAYHSMSAHDEASDGQEDLVDTPSKRKQHPETIRRIAVDRIDESEGEAIVLYQTPRKRRKQEHRARPGSTHTGSLGGNVVLVGQQIPSGDLEWISPAKGNPMPNTASDSGSADGDVSNIANHHESTEIEEPRPTRSSGRQRRKSTKYLMAISEATATNQTPTKSVIRKRGRPRKSSVVTSSILTCQEPQLQSKDHPGTPELITESKENHRLPKALTGHPPPAAVDGNTPTKKRGRPPKAKPDLPPPFDDTIVPPAAHENQTAVTEHAPNDYLEQLNNLLRDPLYEEPLTLLKTHIMKTLTSRKRLPLVGLDIEYQRVHQVVEQTVTAGEGNSMLVIGARGSAKTTLVETVLSQIKLDHQSDFHVVRLNGFIHTDDKIALKEIWRQLGREMDVEDEAMGARNNYADTLASLLALLSHPAELSADEVHENYTAKSVVFILDEFDLFASHSRQTLLYNLFDIAQSRKAPIAVLGLTTKVDVVESLEKRVKSRFSHRYVHLSLPQNFNAFRDICKSALTCSTGGSGTDIVSSFKYRLQQEDALLQQLNAAWSEYVSGLLSDDPTLNTILRMIYAHTKSVSQFFAACLVPVISLSPTNVPTGIDFASNTLSPPDSKIHILRGLSDLELSLLIAAARLDIILDTDTCNFNMAYDEYATVAGKAKLQSSASGAAALGNGARIWGREVAMGAWERLETLEFLMPALGAGGGGSMADIGRTGKLWKVDIGLEEIGSSGVEMSAVMAKWCREI